MFDIVIYSVAYLINPAGRYVACDDPKQFAELLTQGFTRPTPEQEQEHIKKKMQLIEDMKKAKVAKDNIYLATVSQQGTDGYSTTSSGLIRELKKHDVNASTFFEGQKVALLYHNPYSVLRLESPYRIIYTMFESDKIPDDWVEYLEAADKVLVPSKWCQEVFKKAGIETEVLPLGYDAETYQYIERPIKSKTRENFTFLHYNAFNIRKGFPEVLKAFTKAFKRDEPVRMIFKTTQNTLPFPLVQSEYPHIEVIKGKFNAVEMSELLARSDCFVFPSRGEGFGITPLETMATGMSCILPNAHGLSEYFNPECMYEVKVKEMCPALYSSYKGVDVGKMVVCDVDDLARQMRYVYDHQEEAHVKGKQASEYVKEFTIEKTGEKLAGILKKAIDMPLEDKPIRNQLNLEKIT